MSPEHVIRKNQRSGSDQANSRTDLISLTHQINSRTGCLSKLLTTTQLRLLLRSVNTKINN